MSIALSSDTKQAKPSIWQRQILLGSRLKTKERLALYQQWSVLLGAGLGIIDCLTILSGQQKQPHIQAMLISLIERLEAGSSLSDSLAQQKGWFDSFELQSIRIGEQTGQLAQVLKQLAAFYEKRMRLKRKLMQALSYPITVIVIALGVVAFMLGKVVPMFEDIFSRFDAKLPGITQAIMDASTYLRMYAGELVGILFGMMMLFLWLKKRQRFQFVLALFLMKIPLVGAMLRQLHLARLAAGLSMLLQAKVPLDQAMSLMVDMVRFAPLRSPLLQIREAIVQGKMLWEAAAQAHIFPQDFIQILQVGEKTAQLREMLAHYAEIAEGEAEARLNQLTQLLEPVLILTLGGIVAIILVAMYLPMFELSSVMG